MLDAVSGCGFGFLRDSEQPYMWPVVQAEHRALEQLDVPRFTATTDGTWLATTSQERIDDCFGETGYAHVILANGQTVVSQVSGDPHLGTGDAATMTLSPQHIHLFDESGAAIPADTR